MNEDLRRIVKELEEANLVTPASVRRHEDRIKEHQEWLGRTSCLLPGIGS